MMAKQRVNVRSEDILGYVRAMGHPVPDNATIKWNGRSVSVVWDDEDVTWLDDDNQPVYTPGPLRILPA